MSGIVYEARAIEPQSFGLAGFKRGPNGGAEYAYGRIALGTHRLCWHAMVLAGFVAGT